MKTRFLSLIAFLALTVSALAAPAADPNAVRIVVPVREIARGTVIADSDLTYQFVPAARLLGGTVTAYSELVGMETRRLLRADESVRNDDVRRPIVVNKGSSVTMIFEAPGITLTAVGRALSEGGIGDTVTVQNPASFRQISAVVTGPGTVRTGSAARIVASAR